MNFEFILASGNKHKANEFQELYLNSNIKIISMEKKIEVIEDGSTYFENAFKKAKAYYDFYKMPSLADDSGLNVEALPLLLGIHSARFGGEGLTDKERAILLLEKMKNIENRKSSFTCVLCFYINEKEVFYFEGRMSGRIGMNYFGENGFGYDPVFIPDLNTDHEQVISELSEFKMKNSHRAIAVQLSKKFFANRS